MNKLVVGDTVNWKVTDEGPIYTGLVTSIYPHGKSPYWQPFLMASVKTEMDPNMGRINMAIDLSNPTLVKL